MGWLRRRLRRTDWLGELQGLTVLGMAVAVVGSAIRVGTLAAGDDGAPLALQARSLDGLAGARPEAGGAVVAGDGWVEAYLPDPSGHQALLSTLTWLPTVVLVVAVLALLFVILRDARRTDPFTVRTVRRLRILAVVALVGGAAVSLTETFSMMSLVDSALPAEAGFYGLLTLPIGWVFAGAGFLALGEVIRRGLALRDELAEVI